MNPIQKSALCSSLGALIIGFAAILVRAIDMSSAGIAFYRMLIAAPFLFFIAYWQKPSIRGVHQGLALLGGFAFAVDLFIWHHSIERVGAGLATVLGSTQAIYLSCWSALRREAPLSSKMLLSLCLGLTGVSLILLQGYEMPNSSDYILGVILGLATGLCYSTFVAILKAMNNARPHLPATLQIAWVTGYSAIFLLLFAMTEDHPQRFTPAASEQWLYLVILAVGVHTMGWALITGGMARLSSAQTGLILLIQPVSSTLAAHWIYRENFSPRQILGLCMTLASVYLGVISRKREHA